MLLGVSGSVAAIKAVEVAARLCAWADVRVVTTEVGRRFISGPLPASIELYGALTLPLQAYYINDMSWYSC